MCQYIVLIIAKHTIYRSMGCLQSTVTRKNSQFTNIRTKKSHFGKFDYT